MTFLDTEGSSGQREKSRAIKRFRRESSPGTAFARKAPQGIHPTGRKTFLHAQEAALSHRVAERRLSLYGFYA